MLLKPCWNDFRSAKRGASEPDDLIVREGSSFNEDGKDVVGVWPVSGEFEVSEVMTKI
jgi:hypothetical protein